MKRLIAMGVVILSLGMMTACQRAEAEPEVQAGGNLVNAKNPMVEYPDLVSMQNEVGYMMIDLPSDYGMTDQNYFVIGGALAEIRERDRDGVAVSIRKALGQEDISGYYNADFEPGVVGYYEVFLGGTGDTRVSWWKDDLYSYSFAMEGGDEAAFTERLNLLTREAAFIRMFEAELPGGQAVLRTTEELDERLGYPVMKLPETYQLSPAVIGIDAGGEGYIRYREGVSNDRYIDLRTIQEEDHKFAAEDDIATTEQTILDIPAAVGAGAGEKEGIRLARWEHNGFTYSAMSFGHDEEEFIQVLEDLIETTK
jgi:hypothetical protein